MSNGRQRELPTALNTLKLQRSLSMSAPHSTVEYREVPHLTGYRVGTDGSVWSRWKLRSLGYGGGTRAYLSDEWHRLKPGRDSKGYLYIQVRKKLHRVHRLVLLTFVGPCPPGMEGRHFPDRNPENCRLDNLSWATKQQNSLDRRVHGTERSLLLAGEKNRFAKLSDEQVRQIRKLAGTKSTRAIGKMFGVSGGHISRLINKKERKTA